MKQIYICVLFTLFAVVFGCGMTTHTLIARRALMTYAPADSKYQEFVKMATENYDYYTAGAPFPDYLYLCGTNHDNGEYAHWPPFNAHAANYIRGTYLKVAGNATAPPLSQWPAPAKNLMAFVMGMMSHQIADVNWHGLADAPAGYGMIETVGGFDYSCHGRLAGGMTCENGTTSGQVAHTMADTGGEFLASYQALLSWEKPLEWGVPAEDIVAIFSSAGRSTTALSIEECRGIFTAAVEAVSTLAWEIVGPEVNRAPFFIDKYIRLEYGGVDDMALWTVRAIDRFVEWVLNGPPATIPPDVVPEGLVRSLKPRIDFEAIFAAAKRGRNNTKPVSVSKPVVASPQTEGALRAGTSIFYDGQPLSYVGEAIVWGDVTGDGVIDLVIGSPGTTSTGCAAGGAIYVVVGPVDRAPARLQATIGLCAGGAGGRVGTSLVLVDFDLDGKLDIVAGAPTVDAANFSLLMVRPSYVYSGEVFVFRGGPHLADSTVAAPQRPLAILTISGNPTPTTSSKQGLFFFGGSLTAADVNGDGHLDIVVGSPSAYVDAGAVAGVPCPVYGLLSTSVTQVFNSNAVQRGIVHAFVSKNTRSGLIYPDYVVPSSSPVWPYEWFGSSLTTMPVSGSAHGALVIGAPGWKASSMAAPTGRVVVINLPLPATMLRSPATEPYTIPPSATRYSYINIPGTADGGRFGTAVVSVGPGELAIGIPSAHATSSAGAVEVYKLGTSASKVASFAPAGVRSQFGQSLAFGDVTGDGIGDLIVGCPLYSEFDPLYKTGPDHGAIYVYHGQLSSSTPISHSCVGRVAQARFGAAIAPMIVGNHSFVAIGAPREIRTESVDMPGAVHLIDIASLNGDHYCY